MESLSASQKKVLDFIEKFNSKHGYPPTYETIAENLGYAGKSSVQHFVQILEDKGYLTKQNRLSDGLTIHKGENFIPLLGKVAAGLPIEHRKYDEKIDVPVSMLRSSGNYFALQVSGDSMIGEGILDGDYVIIRKQATASNGDIVVAEVGDEATIKRYYKKKNQVELHSANPKYKPIILTENAPLRIVGIWYGLIRHKRG
jgi:repressor LexA